MLIIAAEALAVIILDGASCHARIVAGCTSRLTLALRLTAGIGAGVKGCVTDLLVRHVCATATRKAIAMQVNACWTAVYYQVRFVFAKGSA